MCKKILVFALILNITSTFGQVGIGTTTPTGALDISSTTNGFVPPRIALVRNDIQTALNPQGGNIVAGTIVYNTATSAALVPIANKVFPGFYYWNGTKWVSFSGTGSDDWALTGNSGTAIATNFLGTTDAVDLAIRTNNTERMRVLSGGNVLINTTTFTNADNLFEVRATVANNDAISAYTSGNSGFAVDAYSTAGNGIGVRGNSVANGVGVRGINTANGMGVWGENTGVGNGIGVYGSSSSATGKGLYGDNFSTGWGVYGYAQGAGYGVQGYTTDPGGIGVYGNNGAPSNVLSIGVSGEVTNLGKGVYGIAGDGDGVYGEATLGNGTGVFGTVNGANGYAMRGVNFDPLGLGIAGLSDGITGITSTGTGVAGAATLTGVLGMATTIADGVGVRGNGNGLTLNTTSGVGAGVAGSGTNVGVFGHASNTTGNKNGGVFTSEHGAAGTADNPYAYLAGSDGTITYGGYFDANQDNVAAGGEDFAYVGVVNAGTTYKIIGTGSVSTIVKDENNERRTLFAPEAPEILFQDYGTGQLVNGIAKIEIDPILAKNIFVDEKHPLKVFVQLEGNCQGVFVSNKSANGFTVEELNFGKSNTPFSWFLVATRKNETDSSGKVLSKHEGVRFPMAPGPIKHTDLKTTEVKISKEKIITTKKVKTSGINEKNIQE